ncbi:BglG family transcription antiterminator LicT [uncultured Catenibacterium sp.]|uniref:BglG family transcription antiterminator LicT n=1 Tax=uncultured Catenibacterium sp. TaxID=286142 RepID=UPI0025CCA600|nr:PRD domain-containing protein [uncultured Catenibacterium sp.]
MKISKLLNNNVAVVMENDEEKIVMGRGICFKKKVGDLINPKQVDKVFFLEDQEVSRRFKELVVNIPLEYLQIGDEIFDEAKMTLGKPINDNCYIALVDHIYTACERVKEGIFVKNALLWDIKRFYKIEYEVGKRSLQIIKDKTGIELSDDEAGFIALHIVNGQLDKDSHDMYEITKIMQEVENIVRYHFRVDFNEDSAYYYRFVTHLKFFAQRLLEHKTQESQEDDLLSVVQVKYANAYQCVEKIVQFISKQYNYELSDEEKLYLTIHIHRVVYLGNSR